MFCAFFFNDTATTEIYTLSLHDALPIAAGLTSAITNPMAAEVKAAIMAADVLMGHDQDAGRWIRAHRAAAAVSAAAASAAAVSAAAVSAAGLVPPGGPSADTA